MRKQGGTPFWRDTFVTLPGISPLCVGRGCFVGGHQLRLAGCKLPPLLMCGASSCTSQRRCHREPWDAPQRPTAATYLTTSEALRAESYCKAPTNLLTFLRCTYLNHF